jgi:hypothetical protein
MDAVPYVIGTDIRTIQVKLSQIHASVQSMVREKNIRHRWAEVYRALYSPTTGLVVSTPFPRFIGRIDGAPLVTPEEGGEGSVTVKIVSSTVDLTRVNTAMKSDAQQRTRDGDTFREFADVAGDVEIWWGETSSKSASGGS